VRRTFATITSLRLGELLLPSKRLLITEQHIVVTVAVERRIEIDKIDAFGGDVLAQDRKVVAVEQRVGGYGLLHHSPPIAGSGHYPSATYAPQFPVEASILG
jgi:hypothetical protein